MITISNSFNKIILVNILLILFVTSCCKASEKNIQIGMNENEVKKLLGEPDDSSTVSLDKLPMAIRSHFSPTIKVIKRVVYQCPLVSDLYVFYDDLNVVAFTAEGEHGSME